MSSFQIVLDLKQQFLWNLLENLYHQLYAGSEYSFKSPINITFLLSSFIAAWNRVC
jgi:hypothetical protein